MNPHCPIHVSVKMRRESVTATPGSRPTAKALVIRTFYRCRVLGCPRVEEGKVIYTGKSWAGEFLEA